MTVWYAVHVLTGFSEPGAVREDIIVEENVYIVECESVDQASQHAERLAERSAQTKVSYHPGRTMIENLGVRRVLEVSNQELGNVERPRHETEVTYEAMRFDNRQDVELYRWNVSFRALFGRRRRSE